MQYLDDQIESALDINFRRVSVVFHERQPAQTRHDRMMTAITAMVFNGTLTGREAEELIEKADQLLQAQAHDWANGQIYPVGT